MNSKKKNPKTTSVIHKFRWELDLPDLRTVFFPSDLFLVFWTAPFEVLSSIQKYFGHHKKERWRCYLILERFLRGFSVIWCSLRWKLKESFLWKRIFQVGKRVETVRNSWEIFGKLQSRRNHLQSQIDIATKNAINHKLFWHWAFLFVSLHSSWINSIRFLSPCDEKGKGLKNSRKETLICLWKSTNFITWFTVTAWIHLSPHSIDSRMSQLAQIFRESIKIKTSGHRILNSNHSANAAKLSGTNSIDQQQKTLFDYSSIRWKMHSQLHFTDEFLFREFFLPHRPEAKRTVIMKKRLLN
jgi:hypothetical protein